MFLKYSDDINCKSDYLQMLWSYHFYQYSYDKHTPPVHLPHTKKTVIQRYQKFISPARTISWVASFKEEWLQQIWEVVRKKKKTYTHWSKRFEYNFSGIHFPTKKPSPDHFLWYFYLTEYLLCLLQLSHIWINSVKQTIFFHIQH